MIDPQPESLLAELDALPDPPLTPRLAAIECQLGRMESERLKLEARVDKLAKDFVAAIRLMNKEIAKLRS